MLDAGAGDAPYKDLFSHVQYESADFEQSNRPYGKSTYVCNLCEHIPVEDGRFDYIVFNQTLRTPRQAANCSAGIAPRLEGRRPYYVCRAAVL